MEAPLKVTIAIDNTPTDKYITGFLLMLSEIVKISEINLVHVVDNNPPPEAEIKEAIVKNLQSLLPSGSKIRILVGGVMSEIMKFIIENNQDGLVMGKKSGKLDNKLINKAPVSTLVVPEQFKEKISTIVVPVDFSRRSSLAVKTALSIQKNNSAKVLLLNVYSVMPGYTRIGKTFREAAENMKHAAEEDAREYLAKYKINPEEVEFKFVLDDDTGPADKIYSFAKEKHADLVIISSKGRTDGAAMLLGSIAEKVSNIDTDIPLWVVKEKGETLSFLEALLKL